MKRLTAVATTVRRRPWIVVAALAVVVATAAGATTLVRRGGDSGELGLSARVLAIQAHDIGRWNARLTSNTVTVGGDDARGAVRAVTADGATMVIDPGAAGAGAIAAGKTLFLPRVGMSHVDSVTPSPEGLVVAVRPARLEDTIATGGFDFAAPVDLTAATPVSIDDGVDCPGQNGVAHAPLAAEPSTTQLAACGQPLAPALPDGSTPSAGVTPTADAGGATPTPDTGSPTPGAVTGAPTADTATPDAGTATPDAGTATPAAAIPTTPGPAALAASHPDVAHQLPQLPQLSPLRLVAAPGPAPGGGRITANLSQSGKFGVWSYTVTFTPQGSDLGIAVSLKPATIGGSVSIKGTLRGFNVAGAVRIDGCKKNFSFTADRLHGDLQVAWDLQNAKGVFASNLTIHPTLKLAVPIGSVGGLPLQVVIGTGFTLGPALSTSGDHSAGTAAAHFDGKASFQVAGGKASAQPGITIGVDAPNAATLSAGGGGGFFVAAQTLGLGLGDVRTSSALATISMVASGQNVSEGTLGLAARNCAGAAGTVNAGLNSALGHTTVPVARTTVGTQQRSQGAC